MSIQYAEVALQRCSHEKAPQNMRSKSTGEHPWQSVTPTKPPCSFIEVTLQYRCSPTSPPHHTKHAPTRAPQKDCIRVYSKIQINLK